MLHIASARIIERYISNRIHWSPIYFFWWIVIGYRQHNRINGIPIAHCTHSVCIVYRIESNLCIENCPLRLVNWCWCCCCCCRWFFCLVPCFLFARAILLYFRMRVFCLFRVVLPRTMMVFCVWFGFWLRPFPRTINPICSAQRNKLFGRSSSEWDKAWANCLAPFSICQLPESK